MTKVVRLYEEFYTKNSLTSDLGNDIYNEFIGTGVIGSLISVTIQADPDWLTIPATVSEVDYSTNYYIKLHGEWSNDTGTTYTIVGGGVIDINAQRDTTQIIYFSKKMESITTDTPVEPGDLVVVDVTIYVGTSTGFKEAHYLRQAVLRALAGDRSFTIDTTELSANITISRVDVYDSSQGIALFYLDRNQLSFESIETGGTITGIRFTGAGTATSSGTADTLIVVSDWGVTESRPYELCRIDLGTTVEVVSGYKYRVTGEIDWS